MTPALSHLLNFAVPAPYIAACSRCGRLLKGLAEVAELCPCPGEESPSVAARSKTGRPRGLEPR